MATSPDGHYIIREGIKMTPYQSDQLSKLDAQIQNLQGSIDHIQNYLLPRIESGKTVPASTFQKYYAASGLPPDQITKYKITEDKYDLTKYQKDAQYADIAKLKSQQDALKVQRSTLFESIKSEQKDLTIQYYAEKGQPVPPSAVPATSPPTTGPKPPAQQPPAPNTMPQTLPAEQPPTAAPPIPYGGILAIVAGIAIAVALIWSLTRK